jgi:hypothetical protein
MGTEKKFEIESWTRAVSRLTAPPTGPRNPYGEFSSESSYLNSLHGGAEDPAEWGREIWWETIGDEIFWIYPIYLGSFRGDYSRNTHLLEVREANGYCHPLNPRQFQRLAEIQGWSDLERTAQYRVQESIGSLLSGSQKAILKLLHKIEEYQLFPERCLPPSPSESWETTSTASSMGHLSLVPSDGDSL